jgi:hypothetical protein
MPDTLHQDVTAIDNAGSLSAADLLDLQTAMRRLHASRGITVRVADMLAGLVGSAAAFGVRRMRLSTSMSGKLHGLAEVALRRAFDVAVLGMRPATSPRHGLARLAGATSGAIGGFAGLGGFLPDAAFTTLLIMRDIAAVARAEGEDLADPDARAACLEVFAFGSPEAGADGDPVDGGYWSARFILQGRPLLMLFSEIGARYSLRMSEKLAVQAVPVLGALGGAVVNTIFLDYYHKLAQVHFTVRRLERFYGADLVRAQADEISAGLRLPRRARAA